MTDPIREQLSALLDGELPHDEIGLLVRRLDRDGELRSSFGRYALIGESLRAPGGALASPDFATRVTAAVGVPAGVPATAQRRGSILRAGAPLWKRPVVRAALAASAAAMAILVFRAGPEPASAALGVEPFAASPTPAQSERLASYMVAHSQFSTPMVRRNVLSGLLAADTSVTQVSYDMAEAP
jgi:sigma-E factor negative regulatory protein RseA